MNMNSHIREILEDLYKIDPSLREQEAELMDIIKKLSGSKPESEPDLEFKARLKRELLEKLEKDRKTAELKVGKDRKKILPFRKTYVFRAMGATAAALIAVALGFQFFSIRDDGVYLKHESAPESAVMSDTDITFSVESEVGSEVDSETDRPTDSPVEHGPETDSRTITQPQVEIADETGIVMESPDSEKPNIEKRDSDPVVTTEEKTAAEVSSPRTSISESEIERSEEAPAEEESPARVPAPSPEPQVSLLNSLLGKSKGAEGGITARSSSPNGSGYADTDYTTGADFYAESGAYEEFEEEIEELSMVLDENVDELTDASPAAGEFNTEEYSRIRENDFIAVMDEPMSTFSIDVDTASYANVRRYLNGGALPPPDAVRIEELINYFSYDYPEPGGSAPFSFTTETSSCPWNEENMLLQIGLQGYEISKDEMPPSNLVFLLDVSGSMSDQNKLPLLKKSMALLIDTLDQDDRVAIVAYAGAAGLILPPTSGSRKNRILSAMDRLEAGGSTAGGEGIELAYAVALENYRDGGNNRVIIATDGDFNVGPSSQGELTRMIEEKREAGIFLTVLGLGMGNYKDSRMESLADSGNGNYAYIDTLSEARKVLVNEMESTLFTIAKDVKIQIEFNPAVVESYRLIGYENRLLAARDFDDDTKDAGEIGAGHAVTALYEIVPAGQGSPDSTGAQPDLRYQERTVREGASDPDELAGELGFIKFRYKAPDEDQSTLITSPVEYRPKDFSQASINLRFASSVAEWGMLLRGSSYLDDPDPDRLIGRVKESLGPDEFEYRTEFLNLLYKTRDLY